MQDTLWMKRAVQTMLVSLRLLLYVSKSLAEKVKFLLDNVTFNKSQTIVIHLEKKLTVFLLSSKSLKKSAKEIW